MLAVHLAHAASWNPGLWNPGPWALLAKRQHLESVLRLPCSSFSLNMSAQLVSLGIIHADLKPENALLQMCAMGGPLLTVADYGLSIVMPQGQQSVPHT